MKRFHIHGVVNSITFTLFFFLFFQTIVFIHEKKNVEKHISFKIAVTESAVD